MKTIEIKGLTFGYHPKRPIFENISLKLYQPEGKGFITAVMGHSGSGKSTLLKLILRALVPQKGSIIFSDESALISYIPQEPVLFDHLTPMENATYFLRSAYHRSYFNKPTFEKLIDRLQMRAILEQRKSVLELSGGQKQRIMILRALSICPQIILLDEPTNGLDYEVRLQLLHSIREIVLDQNVLALYCTHNKVEADIVSDDLVYLNRSKEGTIQLFQSDLTTFNQVPPTLEALNVFKFPNPNILECVLDQNGRIVPARERSSSNFYLHLNEQNVRFSDCGRLSFQTKIQNGIYVMVKIGDQQFSFLKQVVAETCNSLDLEGSFLKYNYDGLFQETIAIKDDLII